MLTGGKEYVDSSQRTGKFYVKREVFLMLNLGKEFVKIGLRKCKFYVNFSPRTSCPVPTMAKHTRNINLTQELGAGT